MVVFSNIESLKLGIIRTSKKKVQTPYNILLVGETGTGKSSLLEFIANVLIGKSVDCYDFKILDHSNEQGGSGGQSQTNSARVYELTSKNDILVSPVFVNVLRIYDLSQRFASSTHLDWPILVEFIKTNSIRRVSRLRFGTTSTLSLPFSSSPMAPSLVSLLAWITHSPHSPHSSPKP